MIVNQYTAAEQMTANYNEVGKWDGCIVTILTSFFS